MKKNRSFLFVFFLIIMASGPVVSLSAEITPDQYVFINTHNKIEGESDDPFLNIDFPTYRYNTSAGTLDTSLKIDLTSKTKVILGRGTSLGGSVGGGASTNLVLYNTLSEPDHFVVNENGYVEYYHDGEWIALSPGETWTRTFETSSYSSFSGQLIVTETISNYGIWEKSNITYQGSTTPLPSQGPGDVNQDEDISIVDALLTAQYYVGLDPLDFNPDAADTNCDGSINIVDALLIAQYYVGLITEFC
jgi:hypothetical protein